MTIRHLCIGGPKDGEWVCSDKETFRAVAHPVFALVVNDLSFVRPVPLKIVTYRREVFYTPQGPLSMWVPENQTAHETISRLLEIYQAGVQLSMWVSENQNVHETISISRLLEIYEMGVQLLRKKR